MRKIDCRQGTDEWDAWRNRPTASEFGKFCTPARGDYGAAASTYAAKIVAKQLGLYTEPPPSYWMEWGMEHEPNARHAYTQQTGRDVEEVGFILPDHTDSYGGSPDGLVGDDGLLEIKCPAPETLISYLPDEDEDLVLPVQYRPQTQGLLLISGRAWLDFFVFHPKLEPLLLRVEPDVKYQEKIAAGLLLVLKEIKYRKSKMQRMDHTLVSIGTMKSELRSDG